MKTLRSHLCGRWHEADGDFRTLVNPSTEEPLARASSRGADFGAAYRFALERGGPVLRALTFAARGELLKAMSRALRARRDELLDLSRRNNGTTAGDGSFDVDGGGACLAHYAALGRALGERHLAADDEGAALGKGEGFWGRHALAPRHGVAIHVNAFNFPLWGFAEKAAQALLAGMPVIVKPATATALVTERAIEILVEEGVLPEGALQLVVGDPGDLLDLLGPQDVLAFTGSADTALALRGRPALLASGARVNVEADSLNAAVLGPDAAPGGATFDRFVRDVAQEITQKAGQKCTAIRRILVPRALEAAAAEALAARLAAAVTGDPADERVTMGPLATAAQLAAAIAGVARLRAEAELLLGSGERAAGVGAPEGKGFFLAPTLLRAGDPWAARAVHELEVYAPVATLLPYSGDAAEAARIVALGGGTLVTSLYTDDPVWGSALVAATAHATGRCYWGSERSEGLGSGAVFPASLHGGPGRAGGGEELGGLGGLRLYLQKVALQGERALLDGLLAE
ncbi:MAG TPA: 3,4-dehydroadipyl-CoA semialdehyde dehydrogenase [Thermoanaerobaculia bacterium]|nr:3,4-dehydroadipyl-CoA semialdehyde dehydrogenase [Thermoanaerobaculia bacterium]